MSASARWPRWPFSVVVLLCTPSIVVTWELSARKSTWLLSHFQRWWRAKLAFQMNQRDSGTLYACTSFGTCAPDVLFDEASRVTCHWSLKATKRVVCSLWLIFYCRARRNAHLSAVRPSPVLKLLHTLLGNNIFICSFYCHWKDLLSCKLIPFKRVSESLCNRALCFIDLFLPILPDNIFSPISVYFFPVIF